MLLAQIFGEPIGLNISTTVWSLLVIVGWKVLEKFVLPKYLPGIPPVGPSEGPLEKILREILRRLESVEAIVQTPATQGMKLTVDSPRAFEIKELKPVDGANGR